MKASILFSFLVIFQGYSQESIPEIFFVSSKTEVFNNECLDISAVLKIPDSYTILYPPSSEDLNTIESYIKQNKVFLYRYDSHQNNTKNQTKKSELKTIYKCEICPYQEEDIIINSLTINLTNFDFVPQNTNKKNQVLNLRNTYSKGYINYNKDSLAKEKELTIKSAPITIRVKNATESLKKNAQGNIEHLIAGDFELTHSIERKERYQKFDTINFSINISGKFVNPLLNINPRHSNKIKIITAGSSFYLNKQIKKKVKKLNYKLIFLKSGSFDLADFFYLEYYSKTANKISKLEPVEKVEVYSSNRFSQKKRIVDKSSIIALDVSQSMKLEDYKPTRLYVIGNSLYHFLRDNKPEVDLMLFPSVEFLADIAQLQNIDDQYIQGFTSISDLVLSAIDLVKFDSSRKKTITIISDGYSVSDFRSLDNTANLAKENNLKINTVAIGSYGKVPFGKGFHNETQYINSQFNPRTLIKLSETTGGKFHKFEDSEKLHDFLIDVLFD